MPEFVENKDVKIWGSATGTLKNPTPMEKEMLSIIIKTHNLLMDTEYADSYDAITAEHGFNLTFTPMQ